MRLFAATALVATLAATQAHAQAMSMPANADLRAMQAPIDYDDSRSEAFQENEHIFVGEPRPFLGSLLGSSAALNNTVRPVAPQAPSPAGRAPAASMSASAAASSTATGAEDFAIDIRDAHDHVVETVAHASSLAIARAAFKETVRQRPHMRVTLRRGETVMASSSAR